jgi:peptidoglycan/xylan/chitin deacetylase (PgdA/CDA1 family)
MRLPKLVRKKRGLRNLARTIRKGPFTILLFHSVGRNAAASFLPAGLDCEPGFFRSVLKMLAAEATVLSFHDLVAAIRAQRVPPDAVVITFDDGYRDTLTVAWPLLKEFGFPAILFPPTDAIGSNELLPLHALYYHGLLSGPHVPASNSIERGHYIVKLLREPRRATPAIGRDLYLDWDELRSLRAEGMEIGGHTCSHAWLAALSGEEQQREIADCKAILEKNLGQPVESFAYPFGYYDTSFTNATLEIVRRHFAAAVASVEDATIRIDLHRLPRQSINNFYSP